MRQKSVLLGLVEPVYFIDKKQRALPLLAAQLGRLEHPAQFRNAAKDCADLDKMKVGLIREQPGNRGFANPRRPPENQRRQRARGQHHR